MVYKSEYVLKAFNELFEKKKRPLCLADFKEYFGIREKRDSKSINKALQKGQDLKNEFHRCCFSGSWRIIDEYV